MAPVPHSPEHSSFITWLCLFSPCGPFADWMNWKGWRFGLNNTVPPTPTPPRHISKKPPTLLWASHSQCKFFFCREPELFVWLLLKKKQKKKRKPDRSGSDLLCVRIISIIYANSPDSFAPLELTCEEPAGLDERMNRFNIITEP